RACPRWLLLVECPRNIVSTACCNRAQLASDQMFIGDGLESIGISILQQTPPDANARSTEPPSSCGMRSRMILMPYLHSGEAATAGPPISRHAIDRFAASLPGPRFQFTSPRPRGGDSAPYFAAFVTSSCSTIASTWVAAAGSAIFGPPIVVFAFVPLGAS